MILTVPQPPGLGPAAARHHRPERGRGMLRSGWGMAPSEVGVRAESKVIQYINSGILDDQWMITDYWMISG